MDWSVGVFPMLGALITVISIVIGIRFIFIEHLYSKIIQEYELEKNKIEEEANKHQDTIDLRNDIVQIEISKMNYQNKRQNNRQRGLSIDFGVLMFIIIIGVLSTFGLFELVVINAVVLFLFSISMVDFIHHLNTLKKYKSKLI